ncbi:MAG: four helix bundle protein [bacterium]|nr:four helix bundle protein [bacterium]
MKEELVTVRQRTKEYALRILRLYMALPKSNPAKIFGKQLLRSGTSVGAHYREACRAKSDADFVSKIEGALQELDETQYWLELLADAAIMKAERLQPLMNETDELMAILVSITKRVKDRMA